MFVKPFDGNLWRRIKWRLYWFLRQYLPLLQLVSFQQQNRLVQDPNGFVYFGSIWVATGALRLCYGDMPLKRLFDICIERKARGYIVCPLQKLNMVVKWG